MRVINAFFKAWWLVLSGRAIQPPPPPTYTAEWQSWLDTSQKRLETVFRIAEKANFDVDQRKAFTIMLDKRETTMETILKTVQHNLSLEVPLLLKSRLDHSLLTIRAIHMNDVYRLEQLAKDARLADTVMVGALGALAEHLKSLPTSAPYAGSIEEK